MQVEALSTEDLRHVSDAVRQAEAWLHANHNPSADETDAERAKLLLAFALGRVRLHRPRARPLGPVLLVATIARQDDCHPIRRWMWKRSPPPIEFFWRAEHMSPHFSHLCPQRVGRFVRE